MPDASDSPVFQLEPPTLSPEQKEKHEIFMLLTLALVSDHWCVRTSSSKDTQAYRDAFPDQKFSDYVGHNIGALLVNADDEIVTYSFNCNYLFNDSTEHAETRLVRKALRIANRHKYRSGHGLYGYSSVLRDHAVYTSLESCSQCSGIMDLANVGTVIYAQNDPGQYHIGNALFNLHGGGDYGAPRPVPADFMDVFGRLAAAYDEMDEEDGPDKRPGMTTFLRSIPAYRVFREAASQLEAYQASPENAQILERARSFRAGFSSTEERDAVFGA